MADDFQTGCSAVTADRNHRNWRTCVPITVEPAAFLFCLSSTLSAPVITNLFLVHTCEVSLGFNHTVCQELGENMSNTTKKLEAVVQHDAAYFKMGKTIIEALLPAALSFFIGPWSDLNGRKPLLMWPLFGYSVVYLVFLIESLFPSIPPSILMVSSLPAAFCGGFLALISGAFSYISDVSKQENKALRMGMIEVAFFSGLLVGTVSSSYIYNAAGYTAVFAAAAVCCLLSWLYCFFILQESVVNIESQYSCCCLPGGLFKLKFVSDMIKPCGEERPNFGRAVIWILIIILITNICTLGGESEVLFLFTRLKFGFNLHNYTTYLSVSMLLTILGLFLGTYVLSRWLKLSPTVLAAVGYVCRTAGCVLWALSPSPHYLYAGSAVSLPGASVGAWCRAILSNTVPSADIGKIFALVGSLEALTPLAAPTIYTLVYNATMTTFPGAFYFLSAGMYVMDFFLLLCIIVLFWRPSPIQTYVEVQTTENEEYGDDTLVAS